MITGVILTHNEEPNVVACIEHLRPHVGEIILVDTSSTDRTVELARPLVDQVLSHPHVPNFDSARNLAIPAARFEWLWFVDADEHVPELTGRLVNEWIRDHGDEFEAINIPFKSYFCGRWMQHCGWWPGYTCPRVLKRGYFEFSSTLHAGVKLTGREVRFPASEATGIEHHSFRDLHHWVEKFNRYTSTESLQLAERGITYDWRGALRFMVHDLWEHYELHNARLDGERGWVLTWCAALYRWMSVAKLIDHGRSSEQRGGPSSVPADLDEFLRAFEQELASFRAEQPTLPLGIVWRAPIWEDAAHESRDCVLALARTNWPIVLEVLPGGRSADLAAADSVLLKTLERVHRSRSVVTITQWCACVVPADPCAAHNVLRFPAGSDLPPQLLSHVKGYDELWVESPEDGRNLREQGAAPERIVVVPRMSADGFDRSAGALSDRLERQFERIESRFRSRAAHSPANDPIRVVLEGEFFAGHSFSNINEQLAHELIDEPSVEMSLGRLRHQPTHDRRALRQQELTPYFGRPLGGGPEITIRHAFPANWNRPAIGKWVHIQPWEFGSLPNDWVQALRHDVDEIWVMSRYVERVYLDSGVAPERLHYLPWGIDPAVFRPDVPRRRLPTEKSFRFLYVGGTIMRKGFDRVLEAYLAEFTADDDVCLVIKDVGSASFYGPQTLRDQVFAAQRLPTNPSIHYLDNEMTEGQLASLYAACHCLVAPYRGEGFGLPVLEALACGVPPIIPSGGPTDDFVDTESGFHLPSWIVAAEGVTNLCGPATEFDVSIADVRAAMRSACEQPERTRQMGLAGSDRVRKEFTWAATTRLIVDRLRALAGRPNLSTNGSANSSQPRLAAVIHEAADPHLLVESLARVGPFVEKVYVDVVGEDRRLPQLVHEYGAVSIEGSPDERVSADWVLHVRSGEYLAEEDFERLAVWLQELPAEAARAEFELGEVTDDQPDSSFIDRLKSAVPADALRRARTEDDGGQHPAAAPFTVRRITRLALPARAGAPTDCIRDVHSRPDDPSALAIEQVDPPKFIAPAAGNELTFCGRLKKSVLIQMACGPHLELHELAQPHHRRYAERHGMDYWCVASNPTNGKRPGWGKVPLMLAGLALGYESVIWLDADAVIVQPEIDLAKLVPNGIGMVRHPHPEHWNTGFIVTRASDDVERFWRTVDSSPENNSAWMEQAAANDLAQLPEFRQLLHRLDLRFNSVPGFAMAESPVIVAAHGLPHAERLAILRQALAECHAADSGLPGGWPMSREDFGEFLNRRGLTGEAAEVGVYRGEFARTLLNRWRGRLLHLIDPWRHLPDYIDIANHCDGDHESNFLEAHRQLAPFAGRFRIHRTLSAEAADGFPDGGLDFVYLDANHSFESVSQDLSLWFPKVKRGGILAGHDFLDGDLPEGRFGVASAVRAFEQQQGAKVQLTEDPPWRSWYLVKD